MRRLIAAVGANLAAAVCLNGATAQAANCSGLRTELVSLQSGASPAIPRSDGRYDRARREQADVLARAEQDARRAGCTGGSLLFRTQPRSVCRTLTPKIRRMRSNLAKLERLRARHAFAAGRQASHRRIRQVQAMIARQGCGRPVRDVRLVQTEERIEPAEPSLTVGGGTFRTLCVRACDGYYFPISFSTTRDRFADDLAACESRCPGTEVDLYYHTGTDANSGGMTSIGGRPYSQLPTAFQYRTELDKACTCGRPARQFAVIGTSTVPEPEPAPLPQARPAFGEEPETALNREAGFVPGQVRT